VETPSFPGRRLNHPTLLLLFFSVLLFFSRSPVRGAETTLSPVGQKAAFDAEILHGIHLLYNDRFDEAEQIFLRMVAQSPEEPSGYFYLSMVSWSRLSVGFWTEDVVEEYRRRIDRTIRVAHDRIGTACADSYDYFFLGGALGFKGRFELMRSRWLASFFLARDAIDALKTCLRLDPENKDVLLGLGTFDYYTAHLSGVLKFLTYLLVHKGDKEEGLRKLHTAAREGVYAATEAKSMLVHIYLFLEKDPWGALPVVQELTSKYEDNPRYSYLEGFCFAMMGNETQYRESLLRLRQKGINAPSIAKARIWAKRALYLQSAYELLNGRYASARQKLNVILSREDPDTDPAMIAWPLVKIGMSHDLAGEREKATEYYNRVLDMENGAGAQFLAKKCLDNAPEKQDPFIGL
jgi:tetratricopeptide (TPR) repeat protein